MRIWITSDTHSRHNELSIPENIDLTLHCGDHSNYKQPSLNESEAVEFFEWFNAIDAGYKICIAGNHDAAVYKGLVNPRDYSDIIYLEHSYADICGLKIFGSPYTPSFNNWYYNVKRNRLHDYWKHIPEDTDILMTHGPVKGIADIDPEWEHAGDKSLLNHLLRVKPKIFAHGHFHNSANRNVVNAGIYKDLYPGITIVNAAICDLNGSVVNNGFVLDW